MSKRYFINLIFSLNCWTGIEFCIVIQNIEIFFVYFGPHSKIVLLLQINNSWCSHCRDYAFLDTISLSRYIFIFWLKNPANLDDEFWGTFGSKGYLTYQILFSIFWLNISKSIIIYARGLTQVWTSRSHLKYMELLKLEIFGSILVFIWEYFFTSTHNHLKIAEEAFLWEVFIWWKWKNT